MKALFLLLALCGTSQAQIMRSNGTSGVTASSAAATYVVKTGDTMTGTLSGTAASYTGLVTASSFTAANDASFATTSGRLGVGTGAQQSESKLDVRGMIAAVSSVTAGGQWMRFQRTDLVTLFDVLIASGTNNDNMQFRNNPGQIVLELERASNKIGVGNQILGGVELNYCSGGTFDGNVCRGAACICTAGSVVPLGIYVR